MSVQLTARDDGRVTRTSRGKAHFDHFLNTSPVWSSTATLNANDRLSPIAKQSTTIRMALELVQDQ